MIRLRETDGQAAEWMRVALEQAHQGIRAGQTPFGAVIVRWNDGVGVAEVAAAGRPGEPVGGAGELVAAGHNEVWARSDPTAHAEIVTIQRAAAALQRIDLSDCCMVTTCEPCPMCAAAIHWARLSAVYYGASIADARRAGFNELAVPIGELYDRGESHVRVIPGVLSDACARLFATWAAAGRSDPY